MTVKEFELKYKVAILGCPARADIEWNIENLQRLKELGFNTIQLNIAWGPRPADEALNLEDIVDVPCDKAELLGQKVPLKSDCDPVRRRQRIVDLKKRLELAKKVGLRTLFHFGAPYNGSHGYDGSDLPNCLLDGRTVDRYLCLLDEFAKEFDGVDDILVYTFDQDAWLCNEFGDCANCRGVPLHERVVPFVNKLAEKWKSISPEGKLWWEPWELSAGQVLKCIASVDGGCVGLSLHSNIAEVMATMPVDRWLKNACNLAEKRGINVIVEGWLGGASEELEPFTYLAHPLVTLRQLQSIAAVKTVCGVKEYYGLLPDRDDANLNMTGVFFSDPGIDETRALSLAAEKYGDAKDMMVEFWRLTSESMELFPWETSWYIREIGKCNIQHSMSAAFIRGQQCPTPSWESSRRAIFMKTDDAQPHPWMLEDVQLRCDMAAERMKRALELGADIKLCLPKEYLADFLMGLEELDGFWRRALSYAYHLRETNLAFIMRMYRAEAKPIAQKSIDEMLSLLKADQENQKAEEPIAAAIDLLQKDVDGFLREYFVEVEEEPAKGGVSLSVADFSVTSRKS